jgi:hypothetical protein
MDMMAGLRRGAQQIGNKGGKGATRSTYFARWKPPQANAQALQYLTPEETRGLQLSEAVVFIRGEYEDVYQTVDERGVPLPGPVIQPAHRFRAHTCAVPMSKNGRKWTSFRDVVCSAGTDQHSPQPCVGCYHNDHGTDMNPRDQWAFNVAHLGWYHLVPYVKNNQVQMKNDKSGPIMNKNECFSYKMENVAKARADQQQRGTNTARTCEGCQQRASYTWGDHRLIQVGKNQLEDILKFNDELGKTCMKCGTGVVTVAYDCANPQCNAEILNVGTSGWTNAQIDTFSKSPYQCQTCQFVGTPVPAFECGYDLRNMQKIQGCPENVDPQPLTIFDVVVWIQREGDNQKSHLVFKQWVPISHFKMPDGKNSGYEDNRPLPDALQDIAPKPFDLKEMYAPMKLDEQAEEMKMANPYAQQGQSQPYQAYGPPGGPPAPQGGPPAPGSGYGPPQGQQPQQSWGQPQPQQPPQQQWGGQQPQQPQQGWGGQNPQQPPQAGPPVYPGTGRPNYGT